MKENAPNLDHLIGTKTYDAAADYPGLFTALLLFTDAYKEITGKDYDVTQPVIRKEKGDFYDSYVFADTLIGDKRIQLRTHYEHIGYEITYAFNPDDLIGGAYLWDMDEEPTQEPQVSLPWGELFTLEHKYKNGLLEKLAVRA